MVSSIQLISSFYDGYLKSFYDRFKVDDLSYSEHLQKLLNDSTDFVSSYTKTFNRIGIASSCIIVNDKALQKKWTRENSFKKLSSDLLVFEQVASYKPEVLFIEDLRFVSIDLLKKIKSEVNEIKLFVAYHCAPFDRLLLDKLNYVDLILTCTPGLRDQFSSHNINSYLVYHGFDIDLLNKIGNNSSKKYDRIVFSGSLFQGKGYHNERLEIIEKILENDINISLYANLESNCRINAKKGLYSVNLLLNSLKINSITSRISFLSKSTEKIKGYSGLLRSSANSPVFGLEMYQMLCQYGIVLNNHGQVAGNFAGNMRMFEATGVGACLITDNKHNMPDLFDIDNEVVVYNSHEECLEKIKWLLSNESKAKQVAESGQKKTLCSHTVENRCKEIVDILEVELKKKTSHELSSL